MPSGSWINGLYATPFTTRPTAPAWNVEGGKPSGARTMCSGEKSTLAGKLTTPFETETCCTAAVPRARSSFCDVLTPFASASLPFEESSTMYQTVLPWLVPR